MTTDSARANQIYTNAQAAQRERETINIKENKTKSRNLQSSIFRDWNVHSARLRLPSLSGWLFAKAYHRTQTREARSVDYGPRFKRTLHGETQQKEKQEQAGGGGRFSVPPLGYGEGLRDRVTVLYLSCCFGTSKNKNKK